jgi:Ser/Thr protein kinase RdoA (MazF antagonist)
MAEINQQVRTGYIAEMEPVLMRAMAAYGFDVPTEHAVMPFGYEDFNIWVETPEGNHVIKVFNQNRTAGEIGRLERTLQAVGASDVNHPEVYKVRGRGNLVYHDRASRLSMIAMAHINGANYYQLGHAPQGSEVDDVLKQAVLIHQIKYHPRYLDDSWALQNLAAKYTAVKERVPAKYQRVIDRTLLEMEFNDRTLLPHRFVHGDLSRFNVMRDDEATHVVDFAVANWYPRIQELAVMASSLMCDEESDEPLSELAEHTAEGYIAAGGELTLVERRSLPLYTRAAQAATYVSALSEKLLKGNKSVENKSWLKLGRLGLSRA